VAIVAAATAMVVTVALARSLDAGWLAAIGLGVLLAAGVFLWAEDDRRQAGDVGQGVIVSVVVALAILAVQRDAEERSRRIDRERERAQDRQSLRVTLGLQSELARIDLGGQDLSGFVLVKKSLVGATLDGANLTRAVLIRSDLSDANAAGSRFDRAVLSGAILHHTRFVGMRIVEREDPATARQSATQETVLTRPASLWRVIADGAQFQGADLRKVDLRHANLRGADLTGARVEGADFRQADLRHARVCLAGLAKAKLGGARFDGDTRWPQGFDPRRAGAVTDLDLSAKSVTGPRTIELQRCAPTHGR
jgi:uncharacterized protein YjbI with pentapeptide repeats